MMLFSPMMWTLNSCESLAARGVGSSNKLLASPSEYPHDVGFARTEDEEGLERLADVLVESLALVIVEEGMACGVTVLTIFKDAFAGTSPVVLKYFMEAVAKRPPTIPQINNQPIAASISISRGLLFRTQ